MSPAELDNLIESTKDIIPHTAATNVERTADLAAYCFARATEILAEHGEDDVATRIELTGHIMRSYDQLEYRKHTWSD